MLSFYPVGSVPNGSKQRLKTAVQNCSSNPQFNWLFNRLFNQRFGQQDRQPYRTPPAHRSPILF